MEIFIAHGIPEGHIVIAACKDDCILHMSDECRDWFRALGSKAIDRIGYRCGFAFIGVAGRNQATEGRAEDKWDRVALTRVFQA